jgi:hypothetical protein
MMDQQRFEMRVAVVFTRVMMFVIPTKRRQMLQPLIDVLDQARALASMLFSTSSAIAFRGLLCDSAIMVIAFQSSPILSRPRVLVGSPRSFAWSKLVKTVRLRFLGHQLASRVHRTLPGPLRGRKGEVQRAAQQWRCCGDRSVKSDVDWCRHHGYSLGQDIWRQCRQRCPPQTSVSARSGRVH